MFYGYSSNRPNGSIPGIGIHVVCLLRINLLDIFITPFSLFYRWVIPRSIFFCVLTKHYFPMDFDNHLNIYFT